MYATLIEAFDSEKLQMRLYYLVGYGVPLTIVIFASYMDPHIYNTNNSYCLQANTIIIFSIMFVVSVSPIYNIHYMFLIIIFNLFVIFIIGKSSLTMSIIIYY